MASIVPLQPAAGCEVLNDSLGRLAGVAFFPVRAPGARPALQLRGVLRYRSRVGFAEERTSWRC